MEQEKNKSKQMKQSNQSKQIDRQLTISGHVASKCIHVTMSVVFAGASQLVASAGGVTIEWYQPDQASSGIFFTKSHVGATIGIPPTDGIFDTGFWGDDLLYTRPASRHLSSMSLDLHELAIHVVLVALVFCRVIPHYYEESSILTSRFVGSCPSSRDFPPARFASRQLLPGKWRSVDR
jgi:hypothetical protein